MTEANPFRISGFSLRHFGALLAVLPLAGCWHRYYTVECPDDPPSRSAIAWQVTSQYPGTVRGRVERVDVDEPLASGRVLLVPRDTAGVYLRSDGRFEFANVQGSQELRVHAIGHEPAVAMISVPPDSGVVALVALERRLIHINELCGTRQRR